LETSTKCVLLKICSLICNYEYSLVVPHPIYPTSYPSKLKDKSESAHSLTWKKGTCSGVDLQFHTINLASLGFLHTFPFGGDRRSEIYWRLKSKLLQREFRHRWPVENWCWQNKPRDHNSIGLAKNKQNVQSTRERCRLIMQLSTRRCSLCVVFAAICGTNNHKAKTLH